MLQDLTHELAWWLKTVSKAVDPHREHFLDLCKRLLELEYSEGIETEDAVTRAINHPIGKVTEALLGWWLSHELHDGQGLTGQLEPVFTRLCTSVGRSRHGRVLLAAHAITLFRVDREWTTKYLLPAFDSERSAEDAAGIWEGFLWSPRLYRPLLTALKPAILETARHHERLGRSASQYAGLIVSTRSRASVRHSPTTRVSSAFVSTGGSTGTDRQGASSQSARPIHCS